MDGNKPALCPLSRFLLSARTDPHIRMQHICIFLALHECWSQQGKVNPVQIIRASIMRLAKVFSKTTYHACISYLQHTGYIRYEPSYHPKLGSKVWVLTA